MRTHTNLLQVRTFEQHLKISSPTAKSKHQTRIQTKKGDKTVTDEESWKLRAQLQCEPVKVH